MFLIYINIIECDEGWEYVKIGGNISSIGVWIRTVLKYDRMASFLAQQSTNKLRIYCWSYVLTL